MFLNVWKFFLDGADATYVKLFGEWPTVYTATIETINGSFQSFWAVAFEVLMLVALACVILSIVLKLFCKKANKLAKFLSLIAVACVVLAIIFGCVYCIANNTVQKIVSKTVTLHSAWAIGAYLLAIGGVVASVGAYMNNK